ncbi:hypothetical protein VNI00_002597 [Paramarasmius palmivorus]|uniref:DNA mismatch repair protein MutS core domain-containing protein n=1 Tax=Paramarasmius palmivorus TaxID=297713 RepID=A0AAW0E1L4_9AGAR
MVKAFASKRKKAAYTPADEGAGADYSDDDGSLFDKKRVRWDAGTDEQTEGCMQRESTESGDDESIVPEKICLTAWCQNRRIGAAYYDPVKCTIYTLPDTEESKHFDLMKMILEHANPDILLTSSRSDDDFIDLIRGHSEIICVWCGPYSDYLPLQVEASGGLFQIRPHKDFSSNKGRDRLLSLRLLSDLSVDESLRDPSPDMDASTSEPAPRNAYDFMRRRRAVQDPVVKRWNASIRLANSVSVESSPFCMASVGALLDHLLRERAMNDLEDEGIQGLEVRAIEALSLSEVMQINTDALFSLQIFENESHASVHSDKTKEGFSLAGVLNITNTALGRSLMRMWLLRPSLSLAVINARHDAVECFLRPENISTASTLKIHLKGMKNLPRMLGVLRTGKAKLAEWQGLFTLSSAMLRESLTELHEAGGVDVVRKLITALDIASFRDIGTRINEIIDWEESSEAQRVCVRPHIDEELDNRKHVYHGIDTVLSKVAEQISQTVPPDYATSLNVVYFPQLGFKTTFNPEAQMLTRALKEMETDAGIKSMDGWIFQFSSESHVYFKSQEMHDMDAHIGDLHSLIVDREIEIVQELLEEVLVYDDRISHACDVCAELDCLLAFADVSRMYEYRRPVMVEENVIDIVQGRHPLQEMVVDTFVPNDARVCGGSWHAPLDSDDNPKNGKWNNVVVCTGANACGKSVYLKQVCIAMIVFMAQIGW